MPFQLNGKILECLAAGALLLTLWAGPASGQLAAIVVEGFDVADGSGIGWAPGSGWGGNLVYLSDRPNYDPGGQFARTQDSVVAFRDLSAASISQIEASNDVWIAFAVRLDDVLTTSEFAGVSLFDGPDERFFLGALFFSTFWGGQASGIGPGVSTSTPAGAEWVRLMAHLDFGAGQVDYYVDGALEATHTTMPLRNWDRVRIGSGSAGNRASLDQLLIGTTQSSVEVGAKPKFATSSGSRIFLLDGHRNEVSTLSINQTSGEDIASDGVVLFVSDWQPPYGVATYDLDGNLLADWNGLPNSPSGLTYYSNSLLIGPNKASGEIREVDPATGSLVNDITFSCSDGTLEGLALDYEGSVLWLNCGTLLEAIDPDTGGAPLTTIPDPTSGCDFQGTSITASAPGELTLGCRSTKAWFRISTSTGAVIDSGTSSSSASIYSGLTYLPEPGGWPPVLLALAALATLRRRAA